MEKMIEIKNLRKSFGNIHAVQDISFEVSKGQLFAFLGLNGAGKSTTISILCGQLAKDSGKVLIDGRDIDHDVESIKRDIGVVFQSSALDKPLSVLDNLRSRAALYGIVGKACEDRIVELAKELQFEDLLRRPVGKLSGGQRRRIDVARALLHSPKLLVLDEPTTGLDPQTRRLLWDVVSDLRHKQEMTVFLTTHYMEEAADADRVVILDSGKIVAEGTPLELKDQFSGDFVTLYDVKNTEALKAISYPIEKLGNAYRIAVPNTAAATDLILKNPPLFTNYEVTKGKMDDVFLAATGKKLTGGDAV